MSGEHGKLVSGAAYRAHYDSLSGFEGVCTLARARWNLEMLAEAPAGRVLEVGCGSMILARMAREVGIGFTSWTLVEPQEDFVALARAAAAEDVRLGVVAGYLEAEGAALAAAEPEGFDTILISSLLHETTQPGPLLAAALALARPGARLLANVPNARSFHRLLAVEAGLIPAPETLSTRDAALGHPVVYDAETFRALLENAGLVDVQIDGYLFKPFTHAQMEKLLGPDDDALVEGLIRLGRQFPDSAAEICATGRKPG